MSFDVISYDFTESLEQNGDRFGEEDFAVEQKSIQIEDHVSDRRVLSLLRHFG